MERVYTAKNTHAIITLIAIHLIIHTVISSNDHQPFNFFNLLPRYWARYAIAGWVEVPIVALRARPYPLFCLCLATEAAACVQPCGARVRGLHVRALPLGGRRRHV